MVVHDATGLRMRNPLRVHEVPSEILATAGERGSFQAFAHVRIARKADTFGWKGATTSRLSKMRRRSFTSAAKNSSLS
jgi:hypothetical protein